MPTLFISYKRDDKVAVTKITDRLRTEFYYDIWIDAVSIPGGEDWRKEIRLGIDKADVVLLMLTPDACASEQVKEEVDYAKAIGRKILPLQIKATTEDDRKKLGVEHLNYIDFVGSHDDRFAWEKLLHDLPKVLDRDRRHLDPKFKKLHTDYLRALFAQHNPVNLTYLLDAAPRERVSLLDVYVPLKLGISFNLLVKNGEMVDWWLRDVNLPETLTSLDEIAQAANIWRPIELNGFKPQGEALAKWEYLMREEWQHFKVKHNEEQAKKAEEDRESLKDGTYYWNRIESETAPALMPHLVITGDPGSGKSTLMKHLALCMAGDMLHEGDGSRADLNKLGFWPLPAYTPVFIELRALVRTAFPDLRDTVTLQKLLDYLCTEQLNSCGAASYLDDLRDQMRDGDVMFFLDGLDEVPDADKPERREQIKTLAHLLREHYPQCRIVITSRPYAYAGDWKLDGFGQVKLSALDEDRLEELALRLFRVVLGQEGAEQEAGQFKEQMQSVPEELRSSPLFFTLMASIWLNNQTKPAEQRLPMTKDAIYRDCVEMLIRRWTRQDMQGQSLAGLIGLDEPQLRLVLESLAFQVHSEQGDKDDAVFKGGQIMDTVLDLGIHQVKHEILLDALAQRAGVIYAKAPNRFQFAHRSFQEHLAACYLARVEPYPDELLKNLRGSPALWRNVFDLLPDELRRTKRDLWKLVKGLLPPKSANGSAPATDQHDPSWLCIFYAARLMRDCLSPDDELQEVYRPRLRDALVALVTIGALPPVERVEMGRVLGELGDPRAGVGLRSDGLPDIVWCDVPAGEFLMGSDKTKDPQAYDTETPQRTVYLPAYRISKYPITYAQFQAFIDAPDGFANDEWWRGLAKRETEPGEQRFKFSNHPLARVSWYDAIAFCRWLSAKLGYEIRLPTEAEWEKAARGTDGRLYPYGNEFDATKGNTNPTGIGQTSAVGLFSEGALPYGVLDMSGNVWEWCATQWRASYAEPENNDPAGEGRRVVRGGSWSNSGYFARAAYRSYDAPGYRLPYFGFRVVCGAAPKSDL